LFPLPLVIVLAIVMIRGIARKETDKLGNFWVDTTVAFYGCCCPCVWWFADPGVRRCCADLKPYTTVDLIQPYTAQVTGTDGKTTTQPSRNK